VFIELENAYYKARYAPVEYDEETAEELVKLAEEVIEFVESLRSSHG